MFRKLVSDLAYSPSTIEQLGAYAKLLRRRQLLRETALVFSIFSGLALAFTILAAPTNSGAKATDHVAQAVEYISRSLPQVNYITSLVVFVTLLMVSLLLYIQLRQLTLEVHEIRHEFNVGQIYEIASNKISHKSEFNKIMFTTRQSFGFWRRLNSRILHLRPVEIINEFLSNVLLRPTALLVGAVLSLTFTSLMYILAKYYGFKLAGSEWLVSLTVGWFAGLIFDWIHEGFKNHPDDL